MTGARVEADSSRAQTAETITPAQPKPLEVAHFRAALAAPDAGCGDRKFMQVTDTDVMTTNEAGARAEQLFDMAAHEAEPASGDRGEGDPEEGGPDDLSPARTRAMDAVWRDATWHLPPPAVATAQAVAPKRRVELGTYLARQNAMQPVADLLALVRQRAAGKAVTGLRVVPPEPNPLKLTLNLSMDGDQFVVEVRTALGADRRAEVQQALHVLEGALAARLHTPARVVLLA